LRVSKPNRKFQYKIFGLILSIILVSSFTPNSFATDEDEEITKVPYWIKNNAGWWAQGSITDEEFINAFEFLVSKRIIKITVNQSEKESAEKIPLWIKNNAGLWHENKISDSDFVKGIKYLANSGFIQKQHSESEKRIPNDPINNGNDGGILKNEDDKKKPRTIVLTPVDVIVGMYLSAVPPEPSAYEGERFYLSLISKTDPLPDYWKGTRSVFVYDIRHTDNIGLVFEDKSPKSAPGVSNIVHKYTFVCREEGPFKIIFFVENTWNITKATYGLKYFKNPTWPDQEVSGECKFNGSVARYQTGGDEDAYGHPQKQVSVSVDFKAEVPKMAYVEVPFKIKYEFKDSSFAVSSEYSFVHYVSVETRVLGPLKDLIPGTSWFTPIITKSGPAASKIITETEGFVCTDIGKGIILVDYDITTKVLLNGKEISKGNKHHLIEARVDCVVLEDEDKRRTGGEGGLVKNEQTNSTGTQEEDEDKRRTGGEGGLVKNEQTNSTGTQEEDDGRDDTTEDEFELDITETGANTGTFETELETGADTTEDDTSVTCFSCGQFCECDEEPEEDFLDGHAADYDNDGVIDAIDECPYIPGPKSNNGCPEDYEEWEEELEDLWDESDYLYRVYENEPDIIIVEDTDPDINDIDEFELDITETGADTTGDEPDSTGTQEVKKMFDATINALNELKENNEAMTKTGDDDSKENGFPIIYGETTQIVESDKGEELEMGEIKNTDPCKNILHNIAPGYEHIDPCPPEVKKMFDATINALNELKENNETMTKTGDDDSKENGFPIIYGETIQNETEQSDEKSSNLETQPTLPEPGESLANPTLTKLKPGINPVIYPISVIP